MLCFRLTHLPCDCHSVSIFRATDLEEKTNRLLDSVARRPPCQGDWRSKAMMVSGHLLMLLIASIGVISTSEEGTMKAVALRKGTQRMG